MDRAAFKKQSFEESNNQLEYWLSKTPSERVHGAMYLQSIVYNFDINNPPKMDKTIFSKEKMQGE